MNEWGGPPRAGAGHAPGMHLRRRAWHRARAPSCVGSMSGATPVDAWAPGPRPPASPRPIDPRASSRRPVPPRPTLPAAPGCFVFPASNVWNRRIDDRASASNSSTMIAAIGLTRGLHMDFGSYAGYGIPYQVVTSATPRSTVSLRVRR